MIKNFIYLDEQKMYSLSSQIFEGITEYILNENSSDKQNSETQRGPVGSGRIFYDALSSGNKETEKKFFHDHNFSLFENKLLESGNVLSLCDGYNSFETLNTKLDDYSFISIRSKAVFNDADKLESLFSEFNKIGKSIVNLTYYEEIRQLQESLKSLVGSGYKTERSAIENKIKELSNTDKIARESKLYHDPKFLENLSFMIKYNFSGQFDIQQSLGNYLFTSPINKNYLRESEDLLIKKYSRKTTKDVVVFGIVSQSLSMPDIKVSDQPDYKNFKQALDYMADHLTVIENSMFGKLENEIVIDPIAVYLDI